MHHHNNMEDGSSNPYYLSPQPQNNFVYPPPNNQSSPPPPQSLQLTLANPNPNPNPNPSYPYPPIPGPCLIEPSQPQQQQQLQLYQPQGQQQPFGWVNPDFNLPPPPLYPEARQNWSTGLCDCCDHTHSCLLSCFCPCYVFGKIAEIIDEGNTTSVSHCTIFSILSCLLYPTIYNAYLCGGQACCGIQGEAFSFLAWYSAPFIYTCCFRQKLRRKYKLREAPLWDWIAHFFCMPCSLSQEYRELQTRGFIISQGWEQNVENQSRGLSMAQLAPPVTYPGMTR